MLSSPGSFTNFYNNDSIVELYNETELTTQLVCNVQELGSNNNSSSSFSTFLTVLGTVLHDTTCYKLSQGWTVFLCFVYLFIFLFGFTGNFVVILVIACKRRMKTVTNLFIFNLAVADLLVIVFCVPANLISNLFTPWILGGFLCKAVSYIQGVSVFSSVYSLVAISLERCQAIRKPLRLSQRPSKSQTLYNIALIWISALILTLPWIFVFELVYHPVSTNQTEHLPFCLETWGDKNHEKIYFLVANLFLCYCFPLALITVFNVIIWKSVLQRQIPQPRSSFSISVYNNIAEMHRITRLRVLKMVTLLTFSFFFCWLPLFSLMTVVKFSSDPSEFGNLVEILVPFAQLMGTFNSCVNPIIYAFPNKKYFDETLRFCYCCQLTTIGIGSRRVKPAEEHQSLSCFLKSNVGEHLNPNVVNSLTLANLPMKTVIKATAYSSAAALTAAPSLLKEVSLEGQPSDCI